MKTIAQRQEEFVKEIDDEWVSSVVGAQARYHRDLLKLSAAQRELLK